MRLILIAAAVFSLLVPARALCWSWPVSGPVLRSFSFGSDPYAAGQHRGIDIGAPAGEAVRAPVAGAISFAGTVPNGGKTVTIRTPDGFSVTLLHLGSIAVERGSSVAERDAVGTVASSGEPAHVQPYVYLGVRRTDDPQGYLDPLLFLPPPETAPVGPPETSDSTPAPQPEAPAASPGAPSAASPAAPEPQLPAAPPPPSRAAPVAEPSVATSRRRPGQRVRTEERGSARATPARSAGVQSGSPRPIEVRQSQVVGEAINGAAPVVQERESEAGRPTGVASQRRMVPATPQLRLAPRAPDLAFERFRPGARAGSARNRGAGFATVPVLAGFSALGVLVAAGAWLLYRRAPGGEVGAPMIASSRVLEIAPDDADLNLLDADPRCARVAVRERPSPPWSRGRVRRPLRHLRPLPASERQSGFDGQRHGRAWNARHGRRREGRRLAA